jgi:hypothetical protein
MGADISLRSVLTDEVHRAIVERAVDQTKNPVDAIQAAYDALEATGAYFRDPYHGLGLLQVLDMDWSRDFGPLLSDDRTLSVEAARHFLAELEQRPITSERIDDAIDRPSAGLPAWMEKHGLQEPPDDGIDRAALLAGLDNKRSQLMALLRRSIELGEPLVCDI